MLTKDTFSLTFYSNLAFTSNFHELQCQITTTTYLQNNLNLDTIQLHFIGLCMIWVYRCINRYMYTTR